MSDDCLTLEKFRAAMRLLDECPRIPRYQIIPVAGGYWAPAKRHSKHANRGKVSYHRRIQKKWNRRFGTRWLEIQKRGEVFLINGETLLVRHEDLPEIERAMQTELSALRPQVVT